MLLIDNVVLYIGDIQLYKQNHYKQNKYENITNVISLQNVCIIIRLSNTFYNNVLCITALNPFDISAL